jgi:hypothetical protein
MSSFDVRVFAIRRRPGRKAFKVRWPVPGRDGSRSFMTRALADSYRAELVRAARKGLAFAPGPGSLSHGLRRAGAGDLVPACGGARGDEMPASGAAFAGQPGRRAGHRHAVADPGHRPQAAARDAACRLVRACLQRLAALCPRTGSAWTGTGTPHEPRGLKHRPDGAIRVVAIPPVLVRMLRRHLGEYGSTPDGRLFRGARGGMLSESVYGRAWHAARQAALGPDLAATAVARRPYGLRHAALSLWLNVCGAPAEVRESKRLYAPSAPPQTLSICP